MGQDVLVNSFYSSIVKVDIFNNLSLLAIIDEVEDHARLEECQKPSK